MAKKNKKKKNETKIVPMQSEMIIDPNNILGSELMPEQNNPYSVPGSPNPYGQTPPKPPWEMPPPTGTVNYIETHPEIDTSKPEHAKPGDAGVDLYSIAKVSLLPGERKLIPTGLKVAIPAGCVGLVVPRSGLAIEHGLTITNSPGIIDSGYRGEIKVILQNGGLEPVNLPAATRLAQFLLIPFLNQNWVRVNELPETDRGEGGFGSTGT